MSVELQQQNDQMKQQIEGISTQLQVKNQMLSEALDQVAAYRTNLVLTHKAHKVLVEENKRLNALLEQNAAKINELEAKLQPLEPAC